MFHPAKKIKNSKDPEKDAQYSINPTTYKVGA
jgi:hypothetical protein